MSTGTMERPGRGSTLVALTLHTVWGQLRGVVVWGVILGLYGAAMVATFPSLGGAAQAEQMMNAYPQGMLEAFGIEDMGTVEGFLSGQFFNLAPLALAFFPMLALAGAIAGAEERGSIDILLGNPVPRWQLVVGNALATGASLLFIVALTGAITYWTALLLDVDLSLGAITGAVLNLWPICLFFGGMAMLCSAVFHRRVFAIVLPGVIMLGMYLLSALGNISEDLEGYRRYSVFYHYGAAITDGIDPVAFGGIVGFAVFFVGLAVLAFQRRDIYT
ncbi:MAG: ABC transporter permease subunit [Rubrobacter sp.]